MTEKKNEIELAQFFQESLSTALAGSGLDLTTLVGNGCLCCDVGSGAEIYALLPLQPKILIASEPKTDHYESQFIEQKLKELQGQASFELIRDEPESVLQALTRNKTKFGLITWLRIHPLKISIQDIFAFIKKTKPLLVKGGAVVVSVGFSGSENHHSPDDVDFDEVEGGERIFLAGALIKQLGFKLHYSFETVKESQSAGGVFLIATLP